MRSLVASLCVLAAALLGACSDGPKPEELAARAAKSYYDHLTAGRYADYVAGIIGSDSLPAAYREQLLTNAKQFMALQKEEHGGISEVRIVSAVTDTVRRQTDVFLMLCFGDSLKEEVVVPMVERPSGWKMK